MISRAQRRPESAKSRDRTGEVYGPYVAVRPVGDNPLTSAYWWVACRLGCGYELTKNCNSMQTARRQKRCGGCGEDASSQSANETHIHPPNPTT